MNQTILLFDEQKGKFLKLSDGDLSVSRFIWDRNFEPLDQEEKFSHASLKWDENGMILIKMIGTENFPEDILAVDLDKRKDVITIHGDKKYVVEVTALISLENTHEIQEPNSIDDVFNYLKRIRSVVPSSSSPSITSSQQLSPLSPANNSLSEIPSTPTSRPRSSTEKRRNDSSVAKNPAKKRKTSSAVKVKSKSELEIEEMEIVKTRFLRSSAELEGRAPVTPRRINLTDLTHDVTIRGINASYVDEIISAMVSKQWQHDLTLFVVRFDRKTGKYFVLDGNHRLDAYLGFNKTASEPFIRVSCKVYEDLTYEDLLIVTQPHNTVLKKLDLTELQMAKLALDLIKKRKLVVPKNDARSRSSFNELMKSAIGPDYLVVTTEIIQQLSEKFICSLEMIKHNGLSMSYTKFPSRFWRVIFTAAKRSPETALLILHGLSKSSVDSIQKRLIQVDFDLLRHLSTYGNHSFKSRDDAAAFITGNPKTSSSAVKNLLFQSRVLSNYSRTKKCIDWNTVQRDVQIYMKQKSQCGNVRFIGITVASFSPYNFIVIHDPSPATKESLRPICENAVVVIIAAFHDEAPTIPSLNSALTLQLLVRSPPVIDSIIDELPTVTVAATVYIPELLDCKEEQRFRKLSSLAQDKACRLASTLLLEDISIFGRFAKEQNTALVSHISFSGFRQMLLNFTDFENIHVAGDENIQKCVEKMLIEKKEEELSRNAIVPEVQSPTDPVDGGDNENVPPVSSHSQPSTQFSFSRSPSPN